MKQQVGGRDTAARCGNCHNQQSLTSYTPWHNIKLPIWVLSYLLRESLELHPQVLSGQHIKRKLGCAENTAYRLKRRLQLLASDCMPIMKQIFKENLEKEFNGFELPRDKNVDITEKVKGKPIVYADTLALFSASQRANGGRSRFKHHGQTSSIYLTDVVAEKKGKYQIGTLVHTMANKKGMVFFDSISDQKQLTLRPTFLNDLPREAVVMTDEGYPWLKRYMRNHRAVNHSARSKDKRNRYARNRWSKNGVHNQVAEGLGRILKHSFISGYSYVTPRFSQLYLNEWAFMKNLRVIGLEGLIEGKKKVRGDSCVVSEGEIWKRGSEKPEVLNLNYFNNSIESHHYRAPTLNERQRLNRATSRIRLQPEVKKLFKYEKFFELQQATLDYFEFFQSGSKHRKIKEGQYNSVANSIWKVLRHGQQQSLDIICYNLAISRKMAIRVVRRWAELGVAKITRYQSSKKSQGRLRFFIEPEINCLPDILYSYDRFQFENQQGERSIDVRRREPSPRGKAPKYGMHRIERETILRRGNHEV